MVLRLQRLPPRRHSARHCRARARRHRGERARRANGWAHPPLGDVRLRLRAKGRPEVSWDPGVYLKFGDERTRPAADLLARVTLRAPKRVIDVGCGPGNSTALLAARYPDADLAG